MPARKGLLTGLLASRLALHFPYAISFPRSSVLHMAARIIFLKILRLFSDTQYLKDKIQILYQITHTYLSNFILCHFPAHTPHTSLHKLCTCSSHHSGSSPSYHLALFFCTRTDNTSACATHTLLLQLPNSYCHLQTRIKSQNSHSLT